MSHRALTLMLLLQALPTVLPATGIPVLGQVFTPGGEPRASAEVDLEPIPPAFERARLRLAGRLGPGPVERVRTGVDGTFELVAPHAGMWKVVVSAAGMLRMEYRLIPLVEEAVLPPLELAPVADLEVRLLDAGGEPCAGALGATTLDVGGDGWRPQPRLTQARADGIAHLPLGREEEIRLETLADGHPLAVFELSGETSVEIRVPAGVAGTVRVTDRQGHPLAGALAFRGGALLPLGSSDEEGRIPMVLQPEKPPVIEVSTADRRHGSFELDFDAAGGEMKDLRLDPPAIVRGHVFDLLDRDPLPGALVWAIPGELAVTDQRGSYALEIGARESRRVRAAAAGYQQGSRRIDDGTGASAIALSPAAALSGRVIDRQGAPIDGVEIELRGLPLSERFPPAAHRAMSDGRRGRTSAQGTFRMTGLTAGLGYRLTLSAAGFATHSREVEPLEPFESRSGLELVLAPGRLAFGHVVDGADAAVGAAEVVLRRSGSAPDESVHPTDAEGRFEIADLAPGRYDLEVHAAGFSPAMAPGVRVPEGGGGFDFGTLVLLPGAKIEGWISDADGNAIAAAEVAVDTGRPSSASRAAGGERGSTRSDGRGRFVVADLLPGQPVTVAVTKEGYGPESVESVRPPTGEPLAIVLAAAGRLRGRVVDARGEPIPGATVDTRPDHRAETHGAGQSRPASTRVGADGSYLIEGVEPGTLRVTVGAEGFRQQVQSGIEMVAGQDLELDFELEAGASVEGTVTTADGTPVVQASIRITERRDGFFGGHLAAAAGRTDVDGSYRVSDAPTGPVTIAVYHGSGRQLAKTIEVRPGRNVFDLELERGFEVSGQVVTADGDPVAGASVSIEQAVPPGMALYSFGSPRNRSTGDGTFSMTDVKPGRYALTATREGYAAARSETFEVAGEVSGLLLELRRGARLQGRVRGLDFDELGALALVAHGPHGDLRQGRVDFDAEYAFDGLAPGPWHVQAQVAGTGRSTSLRIDVPEGVPEVRKDIELGSGFTLTGVVLDGGQRLAGARVGVNGSTGSSGHGVTGSDGRFRIEGLETGSYRVMVMADAGLQHSESLELTGDRDLRVEIATGSVRGRVVEAVAGVPLTGAAVALERLAAGDDPGNRAESNSRGRFLMPRVRQGRWRVVASREGYAPGEATVDVSGGVAQEVEIRMTPTEGVSFEVVLESGASLPAVQVTILDPSGRRVASGHYAVIEGRVRVSTLPPGRWVLVIQGGDSVATPFAVTAPGDQGRLVLPIGGNLHLQSPGLEQTS